jgi:fumarate hydratase class II
MPKEVYHAYRYVKKAAAIENTRAVRLPEWKGQLIERVCDEVIRRELDADFPGACSVRSSQGRGNP